MTWCPVWMVPYLTTIDTTIDYSTREAIFPTAYISCSTAQHHQSPVKSAATRHLDVTRTIYQQASSEPLVPTKLTLYHDGFIMSGSIWLFLWMKSTGLLSQVLQYGCYCIQVRRTMGFWWFNMALRAAFFFSKKWEWQWCGSRRTRNLDQQHPKIHESWSKCEHVVLIGRCWINRWQVWKHAQGSQQLRSTENGLNGKKSTCFSLGRSSSSHHL